MDPKILEQLHDGSGSVTINGIRYNRYGAGQWGEGQVQEFELAEHDTDEWWKRYSSGEFSGSTTVRQGSGPKPLPVDTDTTPDPIDEAAEAIGDLDPVAAYKQLQELASRNVKVTADDVAANPAHRLVAVAHLEGYSDDQAAKDTARGFTYLVDMKADLQKYGSLSDGKTKGVLNCLLADMRRAGSKPAPATTATPAPATPDVPAGHYAIEEEGELHFFQVEHGKPGTRWEGFTFLSIQASDDLHSIRNPERKSAILTAIAANPAMASAAYGHGIGRCGVCNRTLTDPVSIENGIGPKCAAKMGW